RMQSSGIRVCSVQLVGASGGAVRGPQASHAGGGRRPEEELAVEDVGVVGVEPPSPPVVDVQFKSPGRGAVRDPKSAFSVGIEPPKNNILAHPTFPFSKRRLIDESDPHECAFNDRGLSFGKIGRGGYSAGAIAGGIDVSD